MPNNQSNPFPDDVRSALENLATALFGLQDWLNQPGKYAPAQADLPWRAVGGELTPKAIGAIAVLEDLLKTTTADDALGVSWEPLTKNALAHCPVPTMAQWRGQRGFSGQPKFGIVDSGNVLLTNKAGLPISRATFYGFCLPLLQAAIAAKPPVTAADWKSLGDQLVQDQHLSWLPTNWPKSSAFVVQFASDILNGMINMRSPAPSPWREALLIELGEGRRLNGKFGPLDAQSAVKALRAALNLPQGAP